MRRTNLWRDFASRVALDERAREAHLQLELERREARLGGYFPGQAGRYRATAGARAAGSI